MTTVDRSIGQFHDASNSRIRKIGRLVGPASYTTGGDATATPALFGLGKVEIILFEPFSNGTVIVFGLYDYTAKRLKFFDLVGNEIANGTDLSTYSARFEAIGF